MSISLAAAGLGGAWQAATTTVSAPIGVADALFVVSGLIRLVLLAGYIRHGGARWRNLRHDLRDPGQGFMLAYVPIVGMLFVGLFARFGLDAARWAYVVFAAMAAFVAARLPAHWFTGTLRARCRRIWAICCRCPRCRSSPAPSPLVSSGRSLPLRPSLSVWCTRSLSAPSSSAAW
ncbi:hypothetical protein AB0D13_35135 [Streptomyces sp. NPDC048430]|uniref:hypothetical protein n=1 Tax=Streptomyces sp. NPDC048430 TaxID=3155388 RepID=UPI003439E1D5